MSYYQKYIKAYQKTPKGRYIVQRASAQRRGISWEFTFETWWEVWQKSGKWDCRGKGAKDYCMSRIHDDGPYSLDNVCIKTMSANSKESIMHSIHLK